MKTHNNYSINSSNGLPETTEQPTHIHPFRLPNTNGQYVKEIYWKETENFSGKAGHTYTLVIELHNDYSSINLQLYLQPYVFNHMPCNVRRKIFNDDGVSWTGKDNDWVRQKSGLLRYEWLVSLPANISYNQYFQIVSLANAVQTAEYQFGIVVSV